MAEEEEKSIEQQRQDSVKDVPSIDPQTAEQRLKQLGYEPHMWDMLIRGDLGSHFIRSLIHIAQGNTPRKLDDVYEELFPKHTLPGNSESVRRIFSDRKEENVNPVLKKDVALKKQSIEE